MDARLGSGSSTGRRRLLFASASPSASPPRRDHRPSAESVLSPSSSRETPLTARNRRVIPEFSGDTPNPKRTQRPAQRVPSEHSPFKSPFKSPFDPLRWASNFRCGLKNVSGCPPFDSVPVDNVLFDTVACV